MNNFQRNIFRTVVDTIIICPNSFIYNISISQVDIEAAIGNGDTSKNGVVYVSYTDSNGVFITGTAFSGAGEYTICASNTNGVTLTYWASNAEALASASTATETVTNCCS